MPPRAVYYPRCRARLGILLHDSSEAHWVEVTPSEVTVENNTHREADTVRLTVPFSAFPLDVRLVRSVWIGVWIGDVEDAAGSMGLDDTRFLAFIGYADEPKTEQGAGGEWVTMTGRDYTGLFLDTPWPGGWLDIQRPLSSVIDEILSLVPGAQGMQVTFADGSDNLDLSAQLGRTIWTPEDGDDLWTVLVTLLGQVALLPVIRRDTLRIETAATFGAQRAAFSVGVNVLELSMRRALHRRANAAVEVIAYDPTTLGVVTVTYPDGEAGSSVVAADGTTVTVPATKVPYTVTGTYSRSDLQAMAERIYTQEVQQAVEGSLRTQDLWDEDEAVRLPLLGNGDSLVIRQVDRLGTSIRGMSASEAMAYLTGKPDPLDEGAARALVESRDDAEALAIRFYVKSARHSWSQRRGYELAVDFLNFVGGDDG